MKTIIAGSRGISDILIIHEAVKESKFKITEVVSGTAYGVDRTGEYWADVNKVPIKRFPALWEDYGKSAGYRRNLLMADYAEAAVIVWDGRSKGTAHMIKIAKEKGLQTFVKIIN
jgi:hypothetical protein